MAELTSFQDWPWQHWASHQPNATALVTDNFSYTWQQLNQQINKLVCHFYDQGLRSQQTVALMGKNSLDLLLCQLAILRCGARILPLNPRLPDLLLSELLPHLNINFAINFSDCTGNSLNFPSLTIAKTAVNADFPLRELPSFSEFAQQPATLILTSGSAGLPKAAVHSISAHLDSANGVLQAMNYQQNDCWLLSLPLFHVSGQGILWRWLLKGGCLAVKLGSLADALNGCTHASLVPTQLWRLLNQPDESTLTLKQVLLGGAMIPTSLTDLATSRGIECWSGYGMTEMASTVCAKRADGQKGVGLPLKGKKSGWLMVRFKFKQKAKH
ncbi:O-succinylbenzoic acid--CoA ligase [Providencia sneebia DSM 19967]|uniref:O-succinylbenzoic acid--CoA ligase n=1 Tax=Providencia sneebia DSM 19967 TaxID=1141660 RepID=K8W4S6_9GAMM|nr:O-succinylbenzoic acid--CoA ligase [Providencia sneebia DSM 19967]